MDTNAREKQVLPSSLPNMNEAEIQDMRTLCTNIGAAIIACQTVEKCINLTMKGVFPKEPIRTVEMLERLDEQHRRKTLGQFIHALRSRVGLAPEFDTLLESFLEHRNTLAHDLLRVPSHLFSTPEGFVRMNQYVLQTAQEANRLTQIFAALIDAWTEQVGMRDKLLQDQPEVYNSSFFAEIRATITPFLDDLVHEKPNE